MAPSSFGYGQMQPEDSTSDFNAMSFLVSQVLGRTRTNITVKVVSVTGDGIATWPFVTVQPTVNQVDGLGNATAHGQIFNIPVMMVGGANGAIVSLPVAGDFGWMAVADRDISAVKANSGAVSNPGSLRRHDLADGVYLGMLLGAPPPQYVQFTPTGIKIADRNGTVIQTSSAGVAVTGNLTVTGNIKAGFGGGDQVGLQTHTHGGVTTGAGVSGTPTPGT